MIGDRVDLKDVLAALRSAWWLPAAGLIIGGLIGLTLSLLTPPAYTAQMQLFVSTTDATTPQAVFQGSQFSEQRATSYAQLLTGDELAARVIDNLGLPTTPSTLAANISAEVVPGTVLIDVAATDLSPERAQAIAEEMGRQFPAFVSTLEASNATGDSPVKVTVVNPPDLPRGPSSPNTLLNVALGLVAGFLVGLGLAVARVRLDRSVKDGQDAADLAGAPVLGVVVRDEALENSHMLHQNSKSRSAEDYRQIRTNLQFLNVDHPPKVIMVSSAVPHEGKTTLLLNLALTLAEAGRRVTIVEADLRRPNVSKYLGIVSGVGLTNVLAGHADLEEVVQPYGESGLMVVASGPTPPNPGELLASNHMLTLIETLRAANDVVLIDAPPLLPVADASGLAVLVDGVLLSVRYGRTRKEQLRQAAATLEGVGAKTLGLILNIVPPTSPIATAYGHGYSYSTYEPEKEKLPANK
jgi:capsular exopolysaccharide synthesis family protein